MAALSATIDECKKTGFFFPPTDHNKDLMKQASGQLAKFSRIGSLREYGVVGKIDSSIAVAIPSACLHSFITQQGGFLVSIDYTTEESIWPFSQYLGSDLIKDLDEKSQQNCLFLYLDCLEVALKNGSSRKAFEGWLSIESYLRQVAQRDSQWRQGAWKIWEDFMQGAPAIQVKCACAREDQVQSREHFEEAHLAWLKSSDVQTSWR